MLIMPRHCFVHHSIGDHIQFTGIGIPTIVSIETDDIQMFRLCKVGNRARNFSETFNLFSLPHDHRKQKRQ